jgi:hypothetical protein
VKLNSINVEFQIVKLLDFLRSKFKTLTGRDVVILDRIVIKSYENSSEALYEYQILREINNSKPLFFIVSRPIGIIEYKDRALLIMERIKDYKLEHYLIRYLFHRDSKLLKAFYLVGEALHEFHNLNLGSVHKNSLLPRTESELKFEIINLSKILHRKELLDEKSYKCIQHAVNNIAYIHGDLFREGTLHGEFYFTHVLILKDNRIAFVDLHNAQRGPIYYDLAMFCISLYTSLYIPYYRTAQIIESFIRGYFRAHYYKRLPPSLKLVELYVALRELVTYLKDYKNTTSYPVKVLLLARIKKLRIILSYLCRR